MLAEYNGETLRLQSVVGLSLISPPIPPTHSLKMASAEAFKINQTLLLPMLTNKSTGE